MSRAHTPGRTFYSFGDYAPWEVDEWSWLEPMTYWAPMYTFEPVDPMTIFRALNEAWSRVFAPPPMPRAIAVHGGRLWSVMDEGLVAVAGRHAVRGDYESAVAPEAVKELVALAKSDNREDFDFLAGACGVEDREALWSGTRARLNLTHEDAASAPSEARQ